MAPTLRSTVLDTLGGEICSGMLPAGSMVNVDDLVVRFGVSRSVVREALSVLGSLGLVASRKRIGTSVLPETSWRAFDPDVIRWRLAGPDRLAQFRTLIELRSAIEPYAAALAAVRASEEQRGRLAQLASELVEAGVTGDQEAFERIDIAFHRAVLEASGNQMLQQLADVVEEVVSGRHQYGLVPKHPAPAAVELHRTLAAAIANAEPEIAQQAARRIVERSYDETATLFG